MKVRYSSNNSGGSWWLSDEDWKNLEKAGWYIFWGGAYFCDTECPGHRIVENSHDAEKKRWLGALAVEATKEFDTITKCLQEFELITGQDVSNDGCSCCGAPHSFSWENVYCSGNECLHYLYKNVPTNLRSACEMLNEDSSE